MTAERAIKVLSKGRKMFAMSMAEVDEACRMACDALRLYSQSFQRVYSINAAIADHYRNIGLSMERLDELAAADKSGRLIVLPDVAYTDADGGTALKNAMWYCNEKNNGVTRFAAEAIAEKLCHEVPQARLSVETPFGSIVAKVSADSDHPGVQVSFHRDGEEYEPTLALVEYAADEADREGPALITRVWGNGQQENYTDRVVYTGLETGGAADER